MEYKLRQIATNKPAGQYFIVSDLSNATELMPNRNLRLVFLNERTGQPNTGVYFERGATDAFQNMFGKRNRRSEKNGNYGIKEALTMLKSAPILAVNLRAFDAELDRTTALNMSANKSWGFEKEIAYAELFNKNGFWNPKPKQILRALYQNENLLNFANVGEGDITVMVTMATPADVSEMTSQGKFSLYDTELNIEEYPALLNDANKLVSETFVNVYVFKNNFADKTENITYRHLFNQAGLISQEDIKRLSEIKSSGFSQKFTGSLIPYLFDGTSPLSIDTVVNQFYQETGIYCALNDDVLEYDSYNNYPVINTTASGYHKANGQLVNTGNLLSYRFQSNPNNIAKVELGVDDSNENFRDKETLIYSGDIFPEGEEYGDKVNAILENGIRVGDLITFQDKDTDELVDTKVIQMLQNEEVTKELPKVSIDGITFELTLNDDLFTEIKIQTTTEKGDTFNIFRKRLGDTRFVAVRTDSDKTFVDTGVTQGAEYVYAVSVMNADFSDNELEAKSIKIERGSVSKTSTEKLTLSIKKISYKKIFIITDKEINSDSYMRRLQCYENKNLKVEMSTLAGYSQRNEQFINGTPQRQKEVLDVMNTPSIVNGITKLGNIGYLIDSFKSYVESGYKHQFGTLIGQLDECNRFVTAILNEPFVDELEESTNPLFKDSPSGHLDLKQYLAEGGNPNYSTQFLTKFVDNIEMCAFYGAEENEPNIFPTAGEISNLYVNKQNAWSIVANSGGILPIEGVEIEADTDTRKAMEDFGWNPIIKVGRTFRIYGNRSGQVANSSLRDFNNSELLKYIKTELLNMSMNDAFTTGTYDEFLDFETRVKDFMDSLALQNAIKPNPIVKVFEVNTPETEEAGLKVCEIEYYNYRTLDKVVFSLKLK